MPELPEIETIVRDIKYLIGKKVIFNNVLNDKIFKTPAYKLDGLKIELIERYGKYIIIKFSKSALLIHLGMAGQLYIDNGKEQIPKHCHYLIQIDNGEQLRYIDHRKFGKIWHMSYKDCRNYVERKLGPEIWDIEYESFILRARQSKYKKWTLKKLLLEQSFIAGIGNIYASEICHEAYLDPRNKIEYLTDKQLENIFYCIIRVLDRAIKNKGTTISDFRTGNGNKGNNQSFLKAYKQTYCKRCYNEGFNSIHNYPMTKEKIDGRMTYYCQNCQRLLEEK